MNTKKIAIASAVGAFALMAMLVAYPAMAASGSPSTSTIQQMLQHPQYANLAKIQLTTGQTVTLTSIAGGYWEVGDRAVNGTASGTMTLQVTGTFTGGYSLTVTGGSFSVAGTTYTISGGSAELGPYGMRMVGQGQSGAAQFLFGDRGLGKFGGTNFAILRVDLKDGSSEFAARLLVTVSA